MLLSTMREASGLISRLLFWPWNSGSRMKTEISAAQPAMRSSAVIAAARLPWPMRSACSFRPRSSARRRPGFMGAAVRGRNGVAIGMDETVVLGEPADGPFQRAVAFGLVDAADEELLGDQFLALDIGRQIVLEAAGEMEHRLGRRLAVGIEQRRRAFPADFDAAEQIGLGARHLEKARGVECVRLAENLRIGLEPDLGAAPVGDPAQRFQPGDAGRRVKKSGDRASGRARPRPRARRTSALTTETPTPCRPPEVW